MQLGFNLRNRVTDTLESSTMLIYLIQVKGIYTQNVSINLNKKLIKRNTGNMFINQRKGVLIKKREI
jgi:hypothetical protein